MGGVIVDHNTFKVNDQGFYPNLSGTTLTPGYNSITFSSGSAGWTYTTTNDKTLLND
jgi:O-acetylhomoserine/O-acetylserine sulfhydrylase-like pyridoxal-dependent enzyme